MATEEFIASISPTPVEGTEARWRPDVTRGADIRFLGVVRDTENGLPILGIDYTCYPRMAEQELAKIGQELLGRHAGHCALVHHRIGFVPAGVASLIIRIRTTHSAEAFELAQAYLKRIKSTLPVWKSVRFA